MVAFSFAVSKIVGHMLSQGGEECGEESSTWRVYIVVHTCPPPEYVSFKQCVTTVLQCSHGLIPSQQITCNLRCHTRRGHSRYDRGVRLSHNDDGIMLHHRIYRQHIDDDSNCLLLRLVSLDIDPVLFVLDLKMKYTVEVVPLRTYIVWFVIV